MEAVQEQSELKDFPSLAKELAAQAIGIDSHIDTIQRVLVMREDLGKLHDEDHVNFPRLLCTRQLKL